MGASSDHVEEMGPSSKVGIDDMDIDDDLMDTANLYDLGEETLQSFCRKAASLFLTSTVSLATKSTQIMPSSIVDSRGPLIHLVRIQNMTYLARMKVLVDVQGVLDFLESRENFPFTIQGIVPDIVINPLAFPSRQIPGQLLAATLGKGIACGGAKRYAALLSSLSLLMTSQTSFTGDITFTYTTLWTAIVPFVNPNTYSESDILSNMQGRAKFSRWGNERVYNGRAGEMVCSLVFVGPIFYQRLIHMAEDKVKFRNTGPVHPLTRHPVAGFGGIKFGEIERDCLLAHGASANLLECLFTFSDSSEMHICQKCKKCGQRDPTGSAWWPQGQGSLLPGTRYHLGSNHVNDDGPGA
ncbi:hypothetical protein D5086_013990 [Populus alba]|uniref:Uncharacterized protein n=1 Tax=Populus alba TaxID=43335 RepID=A0ACC4C7D3_POPAL